MPDWTIFLLILMIIAIILDGLRRVRQHRKENLRLSKRAHLADKEIEGLDGEGLDDHASEFPSGGARKSQLAFDAQLNDAHLDNVRVDSEKIKTIQDNNTLTFDEPVPMLMESIAQEEPLDLDLASESNNNLDTDLDIPCAHQQAPHKKIVIDKAKKAKAHSSLGILADAPGEQYEQKENVSTQPFSEPDDTHYVDRHDETIVNHNDTPHAEPVLGSLDDLDSIDETHCAAGTQDIIDHDAPPKDNPLNFKNYKSKLPKRTKEKPKPPLQEDEPQEVVIVNVMAKNGTFFEGQQLLQAFVDNSLKFGDRDIFHRHVSANGDGAVLFSIANMVVPGTFDLVSIDSFVTPGVSMFMTLPVDEESLIAFNIMIDTAKNLASTLEGELKDENRSVMTAQTIEHAKEKVLEYERKRQLRHR